MRGVRPFRWLTFSISAAVLASGIALLSGAAAGTGLAPVPDDDDTAQVDAAAPADGDDAVVDRLDTWAETATKKKASPVGKGKMKGNDKGRNRLR